MWCNDTHFPVLLERHLCLLSAKLEFLERVAVGHNTVYSINVYFSHTRAHICVFIALIYIMANRLQKVIGEVIHLLQMRHSRNMMNWFVGPELQGHK